MMMMMMMMMIAISCSLVRFTLLKYSLYALLDLKM
jgi:hypothetical protein